MFKQRRISILFLMIAACAGILMSCQPGSNTPQPPIVVTEEPQFPPIDDPTPPWVDQITVVVPPLESLRVPVVAGYVVEQIYSQLQRVGEGQVLKYWPDGNIGFIPFGDQYRFFAANSVVTARTVGTFDHPASSIETSNMRIRGVNSEFAYASGGPIYRDPETGMLLMFYHAERHFEADGFPFHAAIGLAVSHDEGESFDSLGIILESNALPDSDAPCCVDMGGGTFAVKDGWFYLYFRDRQASGFQVELGVATAPVDEVIEAARRGTTSEWVKHNGGDMELGLGGRSFPIELGNPQTSWFSASYNTALDQFIMVISKNYGFGSSLPSSLYIAASQDGITWSPRVKILDYDGDLTYPTIISPDGNPLNTNDQFYIYYIVTPAGTEPPPGSEFPRFEDTRLMRMRISLLRDLVEMPSTWEFDTDLGGWTPTNEIEVFQLRNGALELVSNGDDPYITSPTLGLSTDLFKTIEIHMRSSVNGMGQFFFTTTSASGFPEEHYVSFLVEGSSDFRIYQLDMSTVAGWQGYIGTLRFDPIDREATIAIDYIRLLP